MSLVGCRRSVIASEAKQSRAASKDWIASSQVLLAMTTVATTHRSSGRIFCIRAECAATSLWLNLRWTRWTADASRRIRPAATASPVGSAAAQNRRRSSGIHCGACSPRNPRRRCIHNCRSVRRWPAAAGPCRNIRSSAEVAAPWRSRNIVVKSVSQIGGGSRMAIFPRFGTCLGRRRLRQSRKIRFAGVDSESSSLDSGFARCARGPE
jgi:hypothetical protein